MKLKKLLLICFSFGVAFTLSCSLSAEEALSPEEVFTQANSYYEKGEYEKAISEYKKIIDEGYVNGPVFYNLAGAYFKAGKAGEAVLNYERAKRFMPRDADLIANCKFAEDSLKRALIPEKSMWQMRLLKSYSDKFTLNELMIVSSAVYTALLIMLFMLFTRGKSTYKITGSLILGAIFIVNCFLVWHKISDIKQGAIVTSLEAEAKYGPFDTATKFFTLHDGMKVSVIDSKDDWYKIRRSDGKVGWVQSSKLERI